MKHSKLKRFTSLLLSIMVFVMMTMASAAEVNAASSKTFYVPKTEKTTYTYSSTYSDGSTSTDKNVWMSKYSYGKNGLQTKTTYDDGYSKYTRNSKGYITGVKSYNKKGKLTDITEFTRKSNGDASKQKSYTYSGGKKHLVSTTTYTYWRKGVIKKEVYKPANGSQSVYTYDSKGNPKTYSSNGGKYKISYKTTYKNGRISKQEARYSGSMTDGEVVTTSYTYTIKNKKIAKVVVKSSTKNKEGLIESRTTTTTNTFNKRGDITKTVSETKRKTSVGTFTSKDVTTITYTKVSVSKKYWKLFK